MNTNNICAENELILEFKIRYPFGQLKDLVTIANKILGQEGFLIITLNRESYLGISVFQAKNAHTSSLTISSEVERMPAEELIKISKFNFASAFMCKSMIEFVRENSGKAKIRLVLTLPTEGSIRENLDYQFSLLDRGFNE